MILLYFRCIAYLVCCLSIASFASTKPSTLLSHQNLDIWEMEAFIKRYKQELNENQLRRYFYKEYQFNPKVIELVKRGKREKKTDKPKSKKKFDFSVIPWNLYRKIFIQPDRVTLGVQHYREHKKIYDEVAKTYQMNVAILIAILGIETKYGEYQGKYPVRDTLITNSFHKDSHRKPFYQRQLVAFLQLSKENPFMHDQKGSYAGAMGLGQFIPTSYKHYAVDHNDDGQVDLFHSEADAIASVANYLTKNRWQTHKPVATLLYEFNFSKANSEAKRKKINKKLKQITKKAKKKIKGLHHIALFKAKNYQLWGLHKNFRVIKRYNPLNSYAMAVHQLAEKINKKIKNKK